MTKRRGHGEGSVYIRDKGTPNEIWVGVAHLGWQDGKRQRKAVYGKTQAAAIKKLQEVKTAAATGRAIAPERLTVAQLLDQWLEDAVTGHVRPTTERDYRSIVAVHLKPALGHVRLRNLTPQMIEQMLNAKTQLSARRIQYIRVVLGGALRTAVRWGLITYNAASAVKVPPVKSRPVEAMSIDAARAVLDALSSSRDAQVYVLAMATGLRQGELLALRWQDVQMDAPATLRVTATLQRLNGRYQRTPPKTTESARTIALPGIAIDALRTRQEQQASDRQHAGEHWRDEWGLIFTTPFGKPLYATELTRKLHAFLEAAGLPQMRFHDLRHAAATLMLTQGVPLKVIQTTLGHSTIAVTSRVYAKVLPELQREAADMMDRALRNPMATQTATQEV